MHFLTAMDTHPSARCVIIPSMPAGASVNYTCNMRGRYVNVIIPNVNQYLTLCEVEVYGCYDWWCPAGYN
ncbi:hypothetical protein QTP70_020824 [Hemibagrus guttatus]|uniref:Uncharacterized protein n=1 Tax=Hemibagrus guttatus TaxID=175788 RepID=A0AAE0UH49_9TELE|nr:hypothetical protein QTP70_020824 [Hemibagrus guttatus]